MQLPAFATVSFMKGKIGILMVIAAIYPLGLLAGGICCMSDSAHGVIAVEECADRLESLSPFSATVKYSVTLPQADDDIVYQVRLASETAPGDSLCEARYLIEWELPRGEEVSDGFSAYSDGNHFRYHDGRLQEYHFQWDSIPFLIGRGGVQRSPQFAELLPQMMARDLRAMLADSTYRLRFVPDTVISGNHVAVIKGVQRARGYDGRYLTIVLDPATGRPLRSESDFNPGQISEQSVAVEYTYPGGNVSVPRSEDELIALYPDVFGKYRSSNFRVENLRGRKLPHFSLPTVSGERYTYDASRGFRAPAVIAFLDTEVATAAETVEQLRKGVAPAGADLIMVFPGGDRDAAEALAGGARAGEYVLVSGRSLARDCGVTVSPAVIVADRSGKVTDVMLGFNRNLAENVIQAVALAQE